MRYGVGWVSALATAALLITGSAGSGVGDVSVQSQIQAQLAAHPGGKQISTTEISYDDGRFVITFARPYQSVAGTADCPSGWFCFYDGVNYTYPRGKLSDCGWADLSSWGWADRTESVHYNKSTGSVQFIDTDSVGAAGDLGLFTIDASSPMDSDVDPYRNMADAVSRFC